MLAASMVARRSIGRQFPDTGTPQNRPDPWRIVFLLGILVGIAYCSASRADYLDSLEEWQAQDRRSLCRAGCSAMFRKVADAFNSEHSKDFKGFGRHAARMQRMMDRCARSCEVDDAVLQTQSPCGTLRF